jgi:putative DNA primase/helicase
MTIDTTALRAAVDLVAVVGSRLPLIQQGHEFKAPCPFHTENTPSFYVIPDKNFCHCFGCGWNGDAIEFIMDMDGVDFKTACQSLCNTDWKALPMALGLPKTRLPRQTWQSEKPPSHCDAPETFDTDRYGPAVNVWPYRDADGGILGYVARYHITRNGETQKITPTWSYGKTDGPLHWAMRRWNRPYPLYGLDRLAANLDKQVIIVEGEKTADAAQQLFPASVAITWPGGTQSVEHADWSPVYGRRVVVIPDADEPGREAARYIMALLSTNRCQVKWVDPEPTRPKGWDLADGLADHWTHVVALKWAHEQLQEYEPEAISVPGHSIKADTPAEQSPLQATPVPAPQEPLGHVEGNGSQPPKPKAQKSRRRAAVVDADTLPAEVVEPLPAAFSDDAIACKLAHDYGHDWRYVPAWKRWYNWSGTYWKEDEVLGIKTLVKKVCREVINYEQGVLLSEPAKRSITSSKTHHAVYSVATYTADFVTDPSQWDTDPWLLAMPDGVLELKLGQARPARREDYLTQCTTVSLGSDCPRWLAFMETVTGGDAELRDYLQRLAGYFLTGTTTEQMLAFLYGTGANGKSVFVDTLMAILGDYATTSETEMFMEAKYSQHPTGLAAIRNARLVVAQETGESRKWDEAKIKNFTSARSLKARFCGNDFFDFEPRFKLLFSGNYKPALRSVDQAIRRRVHIIPFTVTIHESERDPLLFEKLKAEHGGILRWMLDGCLAWQQRGLDVPAVVKAATDEYLEAEDAIGGWLEENCILAESEIVTAAECYRNYVKYCETNKEYPWSSKRLIQNLYTRGVVRCVAMGARCWKGIGLKPTVTQTREW